MEEMKSSTPAIHTQATDMNSLPFVTLVMPVRNEGGFITCSLGAVLAQDYPSDRMEVIVADGMSNDGTREAIRSLQTRYPSLQLIDNPGRIVPTGLNAALSQARGEIIVRVDGHCEIAPDYVSRCVEHLLRDGVDGVGGPIETIGENFCAQAIALAMSSSFGVGGSAFRTVKDRSMLVDTIAFPAYTRRAIEKAGLFDEELIRNQDDEYNYRLRELGGKLLLSPDIRSRYYSRGSLRSLWRQYFQYGYWKVRVMQKHPGRMQPRQFIPLLFVVALFGALLIAPFSVAGRWLLGSVAGAYLVANLMASVMTARKEKWRLLPLLPVTYATLHLAYGFGFLVGLAKFWNRWGDRRTMSKHSKPLAQGMKQSG